MSHPSLDLATRLADGVCDDHLGRGFVLPWTWGPALFGFSLTLLDARLALREPDAPLRHEPWLRAWCDHWVAHPPRVDQSDLAAPGLVTHAMAELTGDPDYRALTDRVVDYIRDEPRLIGDATNHLGPSLIGRLYPRSVWVDSLMMFGVFTARYGRDTGDRAMIETAARQPEAYAALMQDPASGLWSHSWWQRTGRAFPAAGTFWGRGNGWVVAALPMIMESIGDHPRTDAIAGILRRTSAALLPLQRADGAWTTLLTDPRSYRELSVTALVGAGWLHGHRLGVLDEEYADRGLAALDSVGAALREGKKGLEMPEVSGPTIPVPLVPGLGYRLTPRLTNMSYGMAAYLMAAVRADELGA
ncbi:glycoside hydrolase family 88 protein [Mariniluteicoccus flavus]